MARAKNTVMSRCHPTIFQWTTDTSLISEWKLSAKKLLNLIKEFEHILHTSPWGQSLPDKQVCLRSEIILYTKKWKEYTYT